MKEIEKMRGGEPYGRAVGNLPLHGRYTFHTVLASLRAVYSRSSIPARKLFKSFLGSTNEKTQLCS